MILLKPPMLIDAFRLCSPDHDQTIRNIIEHYSTAPGGWNHQRCLRSIMYGFNGATDRAALISGCKGKGGQAELDNAKIVEAVLPNILGRETQCFPYKRKSFPLTPQHFCSLGPSFFIVEAGVIKLVYVHARNEKRASISDISGLAALLKSHVLEQDFYGQATDIEVHLVNKKGTAREDKIFDLTSLSPYLKEDPAETMRKFASAFVEVMEKELVQPAKRSPREKSTETDEQLQFPY